MHITLNFKIIAVATQQPLQYDEKSFLLFQISQHLKKKGESNYLFKQVNLKETRVEVSVSYRLDTSPMKSGTIIVKKELSSTGRFKITMQNGVISEVTHADQNSSDFKPCAVSMIRELNDILEILYPLPNAQPQLAPQEPHHHQQTYQKVCLF